jgi:hypothetical protein
MLGGVRWSALTEALDAVAFVDSAAQSCWNEMLALYVRRGWLGREAAARPSPRLALNAVAVSSRYDHVQDHVDDRSVSLRATKADHVVVGRPRHARIGLVIARRAWPRRERRITVKLELRKGNRPRAVISPSGPWATEVIIRAPARIEPLEALLKSHLTRMVSHA